jgi:hypothetical protein
MSDLFSSLLIFEIAPSVFYNYYLYDTGENFI